MNNQPEEKPNQNTPHQGENFAHDVDPQFLPATEEELESMLADDATNQEKAEVTVESLQAQLAEAEKQVLIAHADLENFRRRTRRDMQEQLKYAPLGLMSELLDSVDNLQRAIESYENDPNGDGLVEGVKMVAKQIATTLENKGCKKIEAVGHPFDPNFHQALQTQPSDQFEANTVMLELRPGFQLHDRVVRPAQVFVSTGAEQ